MQTAVSIISWLFLVMILFTVYNVVSVKHPKIPKLNSKKKHIVCVGDSITFGIGVLLRSKQSYPALLEKIVGKEYQVLNYGYSARTLQRNGDNPYTKEEQYESSLAIEGDIYILMLGTNDSKPYNWNEENFKKELKEFVTGYIQLKSQPKVYLMKPPRAFPVKGKIGYDIDNDVIKDSICEIIKETGYELNVEVIDLYALTENRPDCFADGVHPNARGYNLIAEYIYDEHLKKLFI